MKAILLVVIFAAAKIVYVSILRFLIVGWFTVTTKFMENMLANVPDGADWAIFWGRILGFVSHPLLWIFILGANYGNS
ncbi:hypothetical protein WH96_05585 [Kiloniella spongiae]|uniref:Uncharacterized protein n=1 Tax=Kiloniella spongiae TaxID=1489064 RepID=A0A0H2MHU0_9PROT|nr:hypothetical protein [Kiloniella spongiae]KLN61766.1 hypothetical protein WH96_05585 [Kiloniella spongiae]